MSELFAKPGAGGIIEKSENGKNYILIQERFKEDAPLEKGLIEIPAGKIREFENIYDCLRREIKEETGLTVVEIDGESNAAVIEQNGYRVLNYVPFSSSQCISGNYPIMVQVFLCKVEGQILKESNETRNIRWVTLDKLREMMEEIESGFYPMHVTALKRYLELKLGE